MNPNNFILLTDKPWHDKLFETLQKREGEIWIRIRSKEEFSYQKLVEVNPEFIFIPHWSHLIPPEIYDNFQCIVFHMTDLPYGRGGSPLQNLILNGHVKTKVSAIKVAKDIDAGDIYIKKQVSLNGSAREIFKRMVPVINKMIDTIIKKKPVPAPQKGEPVIFKRRKPSDSNLVNVDKLKTLYDYIRMLDCEGYPPAFLESDHFIFEFSNASLSEDNSVRAEVIIKAISK